MGSGTPGPMHPAEGAVLMNVSANILVLGSAATPFGLKAMRELQTLIRILHEIVACWT